MTRVASPPTRSVKQWLAIYGRGIAMGIAEVVPGVSGGTIAFITGIYDELIHALASFRPSSLKLISRPVSFWHEHNLGFLLVLAAGMASGVALFANALNLALIHARPVVWGFFLGLITLSVYLLGRDRTLSALLRFFPVGLIFGLLLVSLEAGSDLTAPAWFFFAGALAVSAWLLPGVSGSFLLLAVGMYEAVLAALVALNLPILALFLGGCVVGLLSFSNLLSWLMRSHRDALLSLLTGFMAGSLVQLWPWTGEQGGLLLPGDYAETTLADPMLISVLFAFVSGMAAVWLLSRLNPAASR